MTTSRTGQQPGIQKCTDDCPKKSSISLVRLKIVVGRNLLHPKVAFNLFKYFNIILFGGLKSRAAEVND
jgi:hypothetical protein